MGVDREKQLLSAEEQTFVEQVATHYLPTPLTATQRAAFDRALEERVTRRVRPSFLRPATMVVTVCAAVLLWFGTSYYSIYSEDEARQVETRSQTENTAGDKNASLLTYAYYNDELYGDEADGGEEDVLPDDYEALATVFVLSEG